MSLMDSLVVQLRNYVNDTPVTQVNQSEIFYKNRKPGLDYEAPFPYANPVACPGIVSDIEGEEPMEYYIFALG